MTKLEEPGQGKSKVSKSEKLNVKSKLVAKTKSKSKDKVKNRKLYIVGLTVLAFRQNLLIKVRANNDYCALLEAMRKLRKLVSSIHPEQSKWVEANWEEEEKMLCARFKDYDKLKDYLICAGFIVSTPMVLEDPHAE